MRYDLERLAGEVTPDVWKGRPEGLWRYREILPVTREENMLSLGEGGTPVYSLDKIAREYGLRKLFLKDEGTNPTGTFKARALPSEWGGPRNWFEGPGNAYCRNAGAAWSHILQGPASRWSWSCRDAPLTTQAECVAYGAEHLVKGLISDAESRERGLCRYGWFKWPRSRNPTASRARRPWVLRFGSSSKETTGAILYPTGGGVGIIGMWKAFNELKAMGWLKGPLPKMVAVQAEGCAPIVKAYKEGKDKAEFFQGAHTIAAGIRVPSALGDFLVLDAVRKSGGTALAVTDEEILSAWSHLAKTEGALICPEGAACVVAAKKLREMGVVGDEESVLILNTGAGMKYTELLKERAKLLESGSLVN